MRTVLNYITKAISVSAHTLSSEFLLRPGMEGVSYSWLGGIALLHVGVFFALASAKSPAFSDLSPPAITMQVEMIAPAAPVPARVVEQVAPRVEPVPKKSPRSPKRPIARPAAQVAEPGPAAFADAQPTEVSSDRHSPPDSKHSPAPVEISQPRFDAGYLKNPAPAYPPASRRLGEEGRVVLRVLVDRDGVPGEVAIKTSSGFPRLDQAAEDAVRRWKFAPARRGDEAIGTWVAVPIVFNLHS